MKYATLTHVSVKSKTPGIQTLMEMLRMARGMAPSWLLPVATRLMVGVEERLVHKRRRWSIEVGMWGSMLGEVGLAWNPGKFEMNGGDMLNHWL